MFTVAFVLAVVAAVIFAVAWFQTKDWVAAGLTVLTLAWILTQTLTEGGQVTF